MVDLYEISQRIGSAAEGSLKWGASSAGGFAGAFVAGAPTLGFGSVGGAGLGAAAGWGVASGTIYGIHRGMKALAEWVEGPPATRSIPTPGPYRGPSTIPPPKVESGIPYDDGVIYWPISRHWDFSARPDPVTLSSQSENSGGAHPPGREAFHRLTRTPRFSITPLTLQLEDAPSRTILGLSGEGADLGVRPGTLGLGSSAGWWEGGGLLGPGPSAGEPPIPLTLNVSPSLAADPGIGFGQQPGGLASFNTSLNVPGIAANNLIPSFGFLSSGTSSGPSGPSWGDAGGGFLRNLWNQGNQGPCLSSSSLDSASHGGPPSASPGAPGMAPPLGSLSGLGASLTASSAPSITLQTPSTLRSLGWSLSGFSSGQLGSSLSSTWSPGGYGAGFQSGLMSPISLSTSPTFASPSFGAAGFGNSGFGVGGFASGGFGGQQGPAGFSTGLNAPGFGPGGFGGAPGFPGPAGGAFGGVGAGLSR